MLAHYLALAAFTPQGSQPTISGLGLTPSAGACGYTGGELTGGYVATAATVRLDWSVTSVNDGSYEVHVVIDGGSPDVLGSTGTHTYTHTIAGRVEHNGFFSATITTHVEVRVVRKSDHAVVQTLTGSYSSDYGTCA